MNDLTCSFLFSVNLRYWLFMANYDLFPRIRLWERGGGVGEGGISYFAYKEMCRWTRYGFWDFRIQFQVAMMHFDQPACPLKALLKFRANYSGTSYFSGRSYFEPVPWCTYTLAYKRSNLPTNSLAFGFGRVLYNGQYGEFPPKGCLFQA